MGLLHTIYFQGFQVDTYISRNYLYYYCQQHRIYLGTRIINNDEICFLRYQISIIDSLKINEYRFMFWLTWSLNFLQQIAKKHPLQQGIQEVLHTKRLCSMYYIHILSWRCIGEAAEEFCQVLCCFQYIVSKRDRRDKHQTPCRCFCTRGHNHPYFETKISISLKKNISRNY